MKPISRRSLFGKAAPAFTEKLLLRIPYFRHPWRSSAHPPSMALAGLILLATLFALTACETRPPLRPEAAKPEPTAEATAKTVDLAEQAGEYVLAAREYQALSKQATPPQRQHYALKAVESLIKAGQVREAREQLRGIDLDKLDVSFQARKQILEAQLAALEGRPDEALRLLSQAEKTPNLNPALIAEIYRVRALAEVALDRPLSAVKSLIARESVIVTPEVITKNQQGLWQILATFSRTQLEQERKATRDPVLSGWLELAIAALENSGSRTALAIAVGNWRKTHVGHPASDDFLNSIARPRPGQIGRVDKIALLLPLTSDYAQAAAAVRDGFLAMSAANPNPDKPRVSVIDTSMDPGRILAAYNAAVQDSAQLIVGPLGLEAVDIIVRNASLDVPTLLLSHATDDIDASKTVFQFGLPPEQEATQVAERAWLDGHRQAALLYPNSAWGRRMQTAFSAAWQRLGGIVVTEQDYLLDQSDYSDPVKRLLNIVQSEARKDRLESVIKMKLKFEPRSREDIDFIFLAADSRHARLIKPQLNFNRASRVPVYTTSHVFTGRGDPIKDIDLDGILFPDMPWMLVGDGRVAELRKTLQPNWPYAHSGLDRLFALGVDAYAVIPYLNRLSSENAVRFDGVTSGLSLGRGGRLHRQMLWAQFRKGVPVLVDTFFRHKGQFDIDTEAPAARPGG
jgi:outer membrane PBP1 activator LpoA protein